MFCHSAAQGEMRAVSRRTEYVLLLILPLVAFGLGVYRLEGHDIWGDEAYSITVAGWPLSEMVTGRADTHPPLHYVLLSLTMSLAGRTPFALRFLSVISGVLVVPLLYRLGKAAGGRPVGFWAAAAGAVSPFLVYYAQEARMYELSLAGATGSLAAFALLLRQQHDGREPARALWGLYALSSLIAVYSHYYAFAVLLAEAAFAVGTAMAAKEGRFRRLIPWLLTWGAMALVFAPWMLAHRRFLAGKASARFEEWTLAKLAEIGQRTLLAYAVGTTVSGAEQWWGWGIVALALGGLASLSMRAQSRRYALLLAVVLATGLVFAWAANPVMPFFWERYLIACVPPFLVLVGAGLAALGRIWRPAAILGMAFVLAASGVSLRHYYADPAYAKGGYGHMMAGLAAEAQAGDLILLNNPLQSSLFDYYRPEGLPAEFLPRDDLMTDEGTDRLLQQITQGYRRVWLVEFGNPQEYDPEHRARAWLGQHGSWGLYQSYAGVTLSRFTLVAATEAQHPLAINLGGEIMLVGYSLDTAMARPGEPLLLTLYWQAIGPVSHSYTVFTHLLDAQAVVQAQMDGQPVGGTRPTNTWEPGEMIADHYALMLPESLAPGDYELEIGMYLWPEMRRLDVLGDDGQVVGDRVLLGAVEVGGSRK
jgi:4-amino-4-deoxy-L-arabinose transferase-like glycosyltransferase